VTKVDPTRQAWAHQYGLDRATMPNLPDVAAASAQQQAAATDLLLRTEAATAAYADPAKAAAAGYDLPASLARNEKKRPKLAALMQRIDAATAPAGTPMPMLHVPGPKALRTDGKALDPAAPETLMYGYQGHGNWVLIPSAARGTSRDRGDPRRGGRGDRRGQWRRRAAVNYLSAMEQRVSLITLGVADVARARAFYERLGWQGQEVEETVFFQAPGVVLVLWGRDKLALDCGVPQERAGGFSGVALAHNVRSEAEVDDVIAAAQRAGATVTKSAARTFYGGYAGVFTDLDGHAWEIAHNPGFALAADGSIILPDFAPGQP